MKKIAALMLSAILIVSASIGTTVYGADFFSNFFEGGEERGKNLSEKFLSKALAHELTESIQLLPEQEGITSIKVHDQIGTVKIVKSTDNTLKADTVLKVRGRDLNLVKQAIEDLAVTYEITETAEGKELSFITAMEGGNNALDAFGVKYGGIINNDSLFYGVEYTIYIPENMNAKYDISMDVGDINLSSISGDLNISSAVGSIYLENIKGSLNIESDVSDIDIKGADITGNSAVKSNVGAISMGINAVSGANNIDIENDMGSIDLDIKKSVNCTVNKSVAFGGESNYSNGTGGVGINIKVDFGSVSVNFAD